MESADIPAEQLRSALEFAVGVAAAGATTTPRLASPAALRPFLRVERLPRQGLMVVRAALDNDVAFRQRIAAIATTDFVDEVGRLWLQRPAGWQERVSSLLHANDIVEGTDGADAAAGRGSGSVAPDHQGSVTAERRRRVAAEARAERLTAELAAARSAAAAVRDARRADEAELRRLAAELAAANQRLHESERARQADSIRAERALAAAADHVGSLSAQLATERAARGDAERDRDRALELAVGTGSPGVTRPARRSPPTAQERRRPVATPSGLAPTSRAAAEHLLRINGMRLLVDGYNVGKLQWQRSPLVDQRDNTVRAAEDLARRYGVAITVVFDGADVVGAAADVYRLVRVVFSPAGVTADDTIVATVASVPTVVPITVASNDVELVNRVRSLGCNTIASEQFLLAAL